MAYKDFIAKAKEEGYSDEEINAHVSKKISAFKEQAQKEDYSEAEILRHLADKGYPLDLIAPSPAKEPGFLDLLKDKKVAQTIGEVLSASGRGGSGLGVLIQRLNAGEPMDVAMTRAAEAVKPGYEPIAGERIGAGLGKMAGDMPLFVAAGAPVAAAAGAAALGPVIAGALEAGAGSLATSAADVLAAKGSVSPSDVAIPTAVGLATGGIAGKLAAMAKPKIPVEAPPPNIPIALPENAAEQMSITAKIGMEEVANDITRISQIAKNAQKQGVAVEGLLTDYEKKIYQTFRPQIESMRDLNVPVRSVVTESELEAASKIGQESATAQESGAISAAALPPTSVVPGQQLPKSAVPSGPIPEITSPQVPLPEKAGNIRLSKISTSDEAKQWAIKTEADFSELINEQKRGVVPWGRTEVEAKDLGLTPKQMASIPGGSAATAAELEAQKAMLGKSMDELTELRQLANSTGSNADKAKLLLAFRRHATLQKVFSGQVAEAGRSLNILRKITDPQAGAVHNIDDVIDALGGKDLSDEILRKLSMIDPKDTFALNRFIREASEATTFDKLHEAWINGLLSSPLTHKRNLISNLLFVGSRIPERSLRVLADVGYSKFTKNKTMYAGEIQQDIMGMLAGISEGVSRAAHVMRHGMTEAQASKLDVKTMNAIKGTLGNIVRIPGTALTASDEFFKAVTGTGERYALAYRMAKKQGLSGDALNSKVTELIDNPTAEMKNLVSDEEAYRTFQSKLGKTGNMMMKFRNDVPGLKYIVPFMRTPINLTKRSLERSPLNAFNMAYKILLREGPYAQEELAKDTANLAMGSMIATTVAFHTANGNITGHEPRSVAEKDAFYRAGKQPYSIKIGDSWYSYDGLEPWSMSISLVADAIQDAKDRGPTEKLSYEAVGNALTQIPANLTSKTFLTGISDALRAITDPERYAERWTSRMVGSLIPASGLTRFTAQVMDSTIRRPETFAQALAANVPILSELVPARLNVFGEEVKRANDIFSLAIVRKSTESHAKVDDALAELGVAIGFPGNKIGSHKLTKAQYRTYLKMSGKDIKDRLTQMVEHPKWDSLDVESRREMVDSIVSKARANARKDLKYKYPELQGK